MIDYTTPAPLFGGCQHPRLVPHAVTYALHDPDRPGLFLYSVHVSVFCPDCQAKFRFLGNNALAPTSAVEAQKDRRGAWVSGTAEELGCMISPIEPGEGLSEMAVLGRA